VIISSYIRYGNTFFKAGMSAISIDFKIINYLYLFEETLPNFMARA